MEKPSHSVGLANKERKFISNSNSDSNAHANAILSNSNVQAFNGCKPQSYGAAEAEKNKKGMEEHRDAIDYLPLYKATIQGDWKVAKSIFDTDPTALTAILTFYCETSLHVAVGAGQSIHFVQKLVDLMSTDSLQIKNKYGSTPLHSAGIVGNTEAAKILVQKNPRLPQLLDSNNLTPLHLAAKFGHKETVRFLLSVTRDEDPSPFTGSCGAALLKFLIIADFYGIALHILKAYPKLALETDNEGNTVLMTLTERPHAFESGIQLGCLQCLLYKFIPLRKGNFPQGEDEENPPAIPENKPEEPRKFGLLQHIYATKQMHAETLELVKLCAEVIKSSKSTDLLISPILAAAKLGIHEMVMEIVKTFPESVWFRTDNESHNIFHLAVLHRKEKVFNLKYQTSLQRHYAMAPRDRFKNNILHLAGKLEPSNRISGAALQMQRELQWFKEVEKLVQPSYKDMKNEDGKTPREVFTEAHKELVMKGEEWMKTTASSCTVVAALVATVVFAAAFTVPGGNNGDGIPFFINDLSFLIFAFSDALALFTSSTSVLMFLSILTSRYSEEDFLKALPMRLSIGLITLFFSIASMLAAFSSSLHIVLVHRLKWVAVPIFGLLACVPVTLFALLQFPLLVQIVSSTFGPSIFCQQDKEIIF